MGIREDAEAAYSKTVEAKDAKAQAAAEKLVVDRAAAEVKARDAVEAWASGLGYTGQAVVETVSFPQREGAGSHVSVDLTFTIDDLHFTGRHLNQSFRVQLNGAEDQDIRDLEQLGKAIAYVANGGRLGKRSRDW